MPYMGVSVACHFLLFPYAHEVFVELPHFQFLERDQLESNDNADAIIFQKSCFKDC